jgi:hypothetical protein
MWSLLSTLDAQMAPGVVLQTQVHSSLQVQGMFSRPALPEISRQYMHPTLTPASSSLLVLNSEDNQEWYKVLCTLWPQGCWREIQRRKGPEIWGQGRSYQDLGACPGPYHPRLPECLAMAASGLPSQNLSPSFIISLIWTRISPRPIPINTEPHSSLPF